MTAAADLERRLKERTATVAVIGLGYVGLPLAALLVERGFATIGFDTDPEKVAALAAGRSYIRQIAPERIEALNATGRFQVTAEVAELRAADAVLICVPTPLTRHRSPDLSFVLGTGRALGSHLRPGQLVVLESTTYPGTTAEELKPVLESGSGLVSGRDFFLAYSPEREDPGNPTYATAAIPKVVGGDGPDALRLAKTLYDQLVVETVPVSSLAAAEAVKLTENIFRAVNIALVNELKQIYSAMGIDIWEVIAAAKTKPFGYMPFYPGPGLGGHCIPIDPFYLTWKAREHGVLTRFVELAGEINAAMPDYVVGVLAEALNARFAKSLNGARILLLGLAYKKNVDDTRESPAFRLIELLESRRAQVDYYDPFVPVIPATREHASLAGRRSVAWDLAAFARYDAGLICTDHDGVDYGEVAAAMALVVDSRNATRGVAARANIVMA